MNKNTNDRKPQTTGMIKRCISVILIITIILGALFYLNEVYKIRIAEKKYWPYFQHQKDYDVLFFGNSHMMNDLWMTKMHDDFGINGYNMAAPANTIPATYWLMRLATAKVKPKLIVMDVYSSWLQVKGIEVGMAHRSLDAFGMSRLKLEAVEDLYGKGQSEVTELMFPFSVYHNRWNKVKPADYLAPFHKTYNMHLGSNPLNGVDTSDVVATTATKDDYMDETVAHEYLRKIAAYCKENNIKLMFVNFPYKSLSDEKLMATNTCRKIADELDVPMVDMQDKNLVDWYTDFHDDSHLNKYGAAKCTAYLGDFVVSMYENGSIQIN